MTKQIYLSKNYILDEFCRSSRAQNIGRTILPTRQQLVNLTRLCITVLQPLRTFVDVPVFVSSGLRPAWLNQIVGGVDTSLHQYGQAADIQCKTLTLYQLANSIQCLGLPYHKLVLEPGWVHVSIPDMGQAPARKTYTAKKLDNGKIEYLPGLKNLQEAA